jgi:hypothetical protein
MTEASLRVRPADLCRELLAALEASEGRRRRRKRDTTPDAIGLGIKQGLLAAAIEADPEPFEAWLFHQCVDAETSQAGAGAMRAMALEVLAEWQLAQASPAFQAWLDRGAPSEDREPPPPDGVEGGAREPDRPPGDQHAGGEEPDTRPDPRSAR